MTSKLCDVIPNGFGREEPACDNLPMVDAELDRTLREAIRTKHLLKFRYKGQERIAEPHDYGLQKGIVRLFCYQVGGESRHRLPGWRWIDVAEMRDCEILERRFAGGREIPSGQHHRWDEVFIRVESAQNRKQQVPRG